jgi:hypothetical protein
VAGLRPRRFRIELSSMPFSLVDLLGGRVRSRAYSLMAFIVTVLARRAVDEAGSART